MTFVGTLLSTLWRRALCVMLLAGLLTPVPSPSHADELRALYAAQGLLCADEQNDGPAHRDPHCVLCLIFAAGTVPEVQIAEHQGVIETIIHPTEQRRSTSTVDRWHRARAPPARFI